MKYLNKEDFKIPFNNNEKLEKVFHKLLDNPQIYALWVCSNINAIDRLKRNDHGPKHIEIVTKNAIKLLRLLHEANIKTSIEKDFKENPNIPNYHLDYKDSEVTVLLASFLHDVGMSVHRTDHPRISSIVSSNILARTLENVYPEPEKTIIISEVLHCIETHSYSENESKKTNALLPLTIEAGVLVAADALDMSHGRAKIATRVGKDDVHSQSALAIKKIELFKSKNKPIGIHILMSSPVGLFQVQKIFKEKINRTIIKDFIEVSYGIKGTGEKKKINLYD